MSLSPRAGNGNNGQPLFALHESGPTPRLGLHLRDCVAAVPTFGVFFNNPLSQSFEGCRPFPPSETGGSSDYPFTAPAVMSAMIRRAEKNVKISGGMTIENTHPP